MIKAMEADGPGCANYRKLEAALMQLSIVLITNSGAAAKVQCFELHHFLSTGWGTKNR